MLRNLWRKSFIYKKFEDFVEAKAAKVARKMINNEIWTAFGNEFDMRLKKYIGDGTFIYCYTDSLVAQAIFKETFEQEELLFLKRFLKSKDNFIDIGANIGLFSLLASRYVGTEGIICSFEPTSITYQRLQENIQLNGLKNIRSYRLALSDTNGQAELQIASEGYDAWNSLAKPSSGKVVNSETVATLTLDSFVEKENIENVSLIKIDVEGWEIPVLQGAKSLLSSPNAPTLMVEFMEENAQNAGFSCKELYQLLVDYGYELFTYDAAKNRLISESLRAHYPYLNIIATKQPKSVEQKLKTKQV
jgi:FkbM family methyltransferase